MLMPQCPGKLETNFLFLDEEDFSQYESNLFFLPDWC